MRLVEGRLKSREVALCFGAIIFAFLGYWVSWSSPRGRKIESNRVSMARLEKDIATKEKLLSAFGGAETASKKDVKSNSSQPVQRYLAINNNFSDLIQNLNGDGLSFRLNRLALLKQEDMASFSKSVFSLEIETSFLNLGQFVEALEKSDFLVEITQVDVSRMSQELRRCTAKITLNSYVARTGL